MLQISDQEILQEIKAGNESAFAELYNHYQPLLLKEAYYKIRSHAEAEDMVQEIFTSLWMRRKELSIAISLKYYLYKAVHLQYAYKCRKNEVVRKFVDHTRYVSSEGIEPRSLENKELGMQIRQAIKNVSAPACRKAFELYYIDDKSHKEIAADMRIQSQVAKNQVCRALKIIRANLSQVV